MLNTSKISDNMEPREFRFNKNKTFIKYTLPLTKYNEQYHLAKQYNQKYNAIHYYIINNEFRVIGRFDISGNLKRYGITYHIIDEFQNRGIGQTVLRFVVDDIFSNNIEKIIILPINERSAWIASKIGFIPRTKRIYELNLLDYQKFNSNGKSI